MKIFEIKKNDAGQRLDKFLSKAVKAMPPSLMYKSIRTKKIKVNRKRAEISQILNEGDTVQLFLSPDLFEDNSDNENVYSHITPSFTVIYEDENILLVNKPSSLNVHSDDPSDTNDLITHIKAYLFNNGEYDPSQEQSFAPALCNRIDRNTSGIVIAAKNAEALREMNDVIKNRYLTKKYLCAVHGIPREKEKTIKGFLIKNSKNNTVNVYDTFRKGSKEIITKYKVLKSTSDISLLEVTLITGRTHQIRAHMASIGHPLVGDGKYGVNRNDKKIGYKYQALSSYYLRFDCDGFFSYLKNKEFTVPKDSIYFIELFDKGSEKKL